MICRISGLLTKAVLLAGLLGAGQALAAQPSGTVKSTHGAWSIICDTPPGATAEQCVMMQNVVAEDRPEMGLSVVVLRTPTTRRVLACWPRSACSSQRARPQRDGKEIGRVFRALASNGACRGIRKALPLLDTLKNGSRDFIVFQS